MRKSSIKKNLPVIGGLFTFIIFTALAFTSVFLQKNLRETNLDTRKSAWVEDGPIVLSTSPAPNHKFTVGEPATIRLLINTADYTIDGVQLYFGLLGLSDAPDEDPFFEPNSIEFKEINPYSGVGSEDYLHFLTDVKNLNRLSGEYYQLRYQMLNNSSPVSGFDYPALDLAIAEISFTPIDTGEIQLVFNDAANSYFDQSYIIDTADHETDLLRAVSNFHYEVVPEAIACSETDMGEDYETNGVITGDPLTSQDNICPTGECTDYCTDTDPESRLVEFYCDNDRINYTRILCSDLNSQPGDNYQCQNGRCINEEPQICAAPTNVELMQYQCSAADQTATVIIGWPGVSGASEYEVQISQDPNFSQAIANDKVGINELTRLDLTPGTWYVRVRVSESMPDTCLAESDWSETIEFTIQCDNIEINPIDWLTDNTYLGADHFHIFFNGQYYYSDDATLSLSSAVTDDGMGATMEASWTENGHDLNLVIPFYRDDTHWWVEEIIVEYDNQTYTFTNGSNNFFEAPLDTIFNPAGEVVYMEQSDSGDMEIAFVNPRVIAFFASDSCGNGVCEAWETEISCPDDCSSPSATPTQTPSGTPSVTPSATPTTDPNASPTPTPLPQCDYDCSWGDCINNWRVMSCSATNEPCADHNNLNRDGMVEYCGVDNPSEIELLIYNYEACWWGNSGGETTYIIWDDNLFPNARWIDVSPYADFREFAHKNIENNQASYYANYLVTDAQGFTWNNDSGDAFTLAPATWYYFRLYNGSHSQVAAFYMPQCAGDDPGNGESGSIELRYCNQSCDYDAQCIDDLTCHEGRCRLPSNLDSEYCAPPVGDQGLNRGCNEYCADTRECADEYECWWNRCRNPENLEDLQCRDPQAAVYQPVEYVYTGTEYLYTYNYPATSYQTKGGTNQIIKGCNEYCTSNAQCPNNHRCYYNQCRLAINPEDTNCQEQATKGGSGTETTSDESNLDQPKGGEITISVTPTKTHEPANTSNEGLADQTAWDSLRAYIADNSLLKVFLLLMGGGIIVFAVVYLLSNEE